MNAVLDAVARGWSWKMGTPVEVISSNRFGNVLVKNQSGHYFRITPEEWQCQLFATSAEELHSKRADPDFVEDWEMSRLVVRAFAAHGPLNEGQVYYLVVPGVLGGQYSEENIRKIGLVELLAYSGDMAQQIDDVPDGGHVKIVIGKRPERPEGTPSERVCSNPILLARRPSAETFAMNARISRLFLIAFGILLLLGGMLLSVPGEYWPWYAITGACAIVAVAVGPRWYRVGGLLAAALALGLIFADLKAGVVFRQRMASWRAQAARAKMTNGEPGGAANRSQPVSPQTNGTSAAAGSGR